MVANVKQAQVIRFRAVIALGLNIDLPLPAKAVEVINEITSNEGLQRLVNFGKFNSLLEGFVAIHIYIQLWHDRQEGCVQAANLRPLPSRFHEFADVGGEKWDVLASPV